MPCYTEPGIPHDEYLTRMLCKACKHLTIEQMKKIDIDGCEDLFLWYRSHLVDDFIDNYDNADPIEKNVALAEINRLGFKIYKTTSGAFNFEDL